MSNSLQPHRLQNVRLFRPSPSPKVCSKLVFIELVTPSNCLILCCPSIFPIIRVFPNESALCIRWPKYWSFCISISSYNHQSKMFCYWRMLSAFIKEPLSKSTAKISGRVTEHSHSLDSITSWEPVPLLWPQWCCEHPVLLRMAGRLVKQNSL